MLVEGLAVRRAFTIDVTNSLRCVTLTTIHPQLNSRDMLYFKYTPSIPSKYDDHQVYSFKMDRVEHKTFV